MATKPPLSLFQDPFSDHHPRPRLRVAIVATPRSGNTWLKGLLGSLYGLPDIICDRPDEVPWETLPERCVLQMHWGPEPELIDRFQRHVIRPVTIARHPLDTLISMLHFCTTWQGTSRWFGGRDGNEDAIRGSLPTSPEFLEYATGPRARTLMSITRDWWSTGTCHTLCYEHLVNDPATQLERLGDFLEPLSQEAIRSAIDGNSLEQTRPKVANQHHWVGTSAHWKRLLPAATVRPTVLAHAASMELAHYDWEPDENLTSTQADLNWFAMEILSLRQEMSRTRMQLLKAREQIDNHESYLSVVRRAIKPFRELGHQSVGLLQRLRSSPESHSGPSPILAEAPRPIVRKAS